MHLAEPFLLGWQIHSSRLSVPYVPSSSSRPDQASHLPSGDQVTVSVDKDTSVTIEGPDKQKVGLVAAELRGFYPVEPYKGKGVKYADEHVRRKEGKTVQ